MYELPPYMLLIDDDEDDLEMLSSELESKGVRVKTFLSPAKALFYLNLMSGNGEWPSLIILDYNMPVKNGYEVLQILKENKETRHIPVVVYSTSISKPLRDQLMDAGALGCFTKPWTYPDMNRQADEFLEFSSSFVCSTV